MRCLFCDKKLSLLKLAKGDSFCSPDHFDAYQLQMSKNDIQRLISLPIGDAPRAPLKVTPQEQPAGSAPSPPNQALNPPPYAPFAKSQLGAFPPEPASLMAEAPLADLRGALLPALPVRSLGDVNGVLNLHRQLSQEMIGVSDWAPLTENDLKPEEFRGEIAAPRESGSPVPEINQIAAALPEPLVASAEQIADFAPEEPVISESIPTEEAVSQPVVAAAEESVAPALEDLIISGSVSTVAPVEANSPAVPQETVPAETGSEPPPEPEAAPLVHGTVRQMPLGPRISFVIAPTFVQRAGSFNALDQEPSVPLAFGLVPQLGVGVPAKPNHRDGVERSHRFAGTSSVRPQDCAGTSIDAGTELPASRNVVLPEPHPGNAVENRICGGPMRLTPNILETGWQGTAAVNFNLPQPASLIVCPGTQQAKVTDPARILPQHPPIFAAPAALEMNAAEPPRAPVPLTPAPAELRLLAAQLPGRKSIEESLPCPNDLQAVPTGRGTSLFDQRAGNRGFSWRSTGPVLEPFSIAFSKNQPVARHLRASIAHGGTVPVFPRGSLLPLGWLELECSPVRRSDPQPLLSPAGFRFLAPAPFSAGTGVMKSPRLSTAPRWAYSMPPSVLCEGMNLPSSASAALPGTVEWPVGTLRIGRGSAIVNWNPRALAVTHSPVAKMLPIRKGPILPTAKSWPRLGALPG